jgi:hypothetical protein
MSNGQQLQRYDASLRFDLADVRCVRKKRRLHGPGNARVPFHATQRPGHAPHTRLSTGMHEQQPVHRRGGDRVRSERLLRRVRRRFDLFGRYARLQHHHTVRLRDL